MGDYIEGKAFKQDGTWFIKPETAKEVVGYL